MANRIKAVNGYYAEYDEDGNLIREYPHMTIDNVKQIAFSGDRLGKMVVATFDYLDLYENGGSIGQVNYPFPPDYFQNVQLSGNTIIIQSTNNETYKCEFGTNGSYWERVWD
jgi:hypothetical protein